MSRVKLLDQLGLIVPGGEPQLLEWITSLHAIRNLPAYKYRMLEEKRIKDGHVLLEKDVSSPNNFVEFMRSRSVNLVQAVLAPAPVMNAAPVNPVNNDDDEYEHLFADDVNDVDED